MKINASHTAKAAISISFLGTRDLRALDRLLSFSEYDKASGTEHTNILMCVLKTRMECSTCETWAL